MGTSWGAIPFHGVYTSYDYGASLSESRELTTKFDEIKRQGLFLRSSPEFYKTDWIADSSVGLAASSSSAAFVTFLRNPDTSAGFYIVRQTSSTSTLVHFNHQLQTQRYHHIHHDPFNPNSRGRILHYAFRP
ncbi:hypothetical protein H0H93_001843 [Arthromyces matolae]|nr:hypothetical protein H0H93_001843 [Arthromyces matolae]